MQPPLNAQLLENIRSSSAGQGLLQPLLSTKPRAKSKGKSQTHGTRRSPQQLCRHHSNCAGSKRERASPSILSDSNCWGRLGTGYKETEDGQSDLPLLDPSSKQKLGAVFNNHG